MTGQVNCYDGVSPSIGQMIQMTQPSKHRLPAMESLSRRRYGCFRVLWRKALAPASAPGQPPSSAVRSRAFSGIRRLAVPARALSTPYCVKETSEHEAIQMTSAISILTLVALPEAAPVPGTFIVGMVTT